MSYQIKFSGSAEIPFELDRTQNYLIAGEFEEISRTEKDNNDGSIETTFKVAPLRLAITDPAGAKVRLKTKNSNSTRIRAAVFKSQQERKGFEDWEPEAYYDKFTDRLCVPGNLDAVLTLLDL